MDDDIEYRAEHIGDDVTLPTFDLLICIISLWPSTFRGFDTLAIHHANQRIHLVTLNLAHLDDQQLVDRDPQTHVAPCLEIAAHRRHREKSLVTSATANRSTRCREWRLSPSANPPSGGDDHAEWARKVAKHRLIPSPSYRLDIPFLHAYTPHKRYHSRLSVPPSFRQRRLNHNRLI
jgi:hypothetical protein